MIKAGKTYRCPKECPIGKKCFIIKVPIELKEPLKVLQKCYAVKGDIMITIGPRSP